MAEQAPSAEVVPEHQDRGLLGLFGNKKDEEGRHDIGATHTQAQAQAQAAHLYPTNPPHVTAVDQQYGQVYAPPVTAVDQQYGQGYAHGHEGQFTTGEAEKQQHTGLLGKLHRTNSSSSSSSSDEEGGNKNEGGRKKKGIKEKIKEKLPGGQKQSDEYGREGGKEGLVDKIKDKLPGHHNKDQ